MFIAQANNRRINNMDRRAQDKIISHRTQGDTILRITFIGAMLLVFALAIATGTAHANADQIQPQAPAPDVVVNKTTQQMLAALKQDKDIISKQPGHVYELANEIVLPHFDFKYMSALALGKHWRRATDDQKQRFPQEFRSLLLRTYATALSEYTNEKVVYLPLRDDITLGDVSVHTEIQRDSGPAIPVSYGLHMNNGKWKVYDIKIDGISLVANYRSTFSSEIRRGGMDKLINKLASRNARVASLQ